MYVFTPEQRCLIDLSVDVWRRRGAAKHHGLNFNEETATEVFLLDLAEQFPGSVEIVPFTRGKEARIGADWAWAFVSPDGVWWQGMLVQAKRLDDDDREYAELYYRRRTRGPQPSTPQLDRLIASSRRYGLPPVFVFYNHLRDPGRVPYNACGSLGLISQSLPESWGIAIASAFNVRNARPDKSYNRHRVHSLPLHCLLCSHGCGRQGPLGSADMAAEGLSRLFDGTDEDDVRSSDFALPFRPRRGLPEIFRFAEQIHQERMGGLEASAIDFETEFPGIAGTVIVRDRADEENLSRRGGGGDVRQA